MIIWEEDLLVVALFRKIILTVLVGIILAGVTAGCMNRWEGKRPVDYPNTTWECTEPNITFSVDENKAITLTVAEEGAEFPEDLSVLFNYGRTIMFHSASQGKVFLRGSCVFSESKLIVYVKEDKIFGGHYTGMKIVFERKD